MEKVHVGFVSLLPVQDEPEKYRLLLKEAKGIRYLPIIFHKYDAYFISEANRGAPEEVPSIYTILKVAIKRSGNPLREVIITSIVNDCYRAELIFKTHSIKCECGDALILALFCKVPIFVNEIVMNSVNTKPANTKMPQEKNGTSPEKSNLLLSSTSRKLQQLDERLTKAVKDENYEEAANLRDEIQKLEH